MEIEIKKEGVVKMAPVTKRYKEGWEEEDQESTI